MRILFVAPSLLLAACSTPAPEPRPVAEMSLEEKCQVAVQLMNSPRNTTVAQLSVMEKARNMGCFGQPQTAR